MPRPRMKIKTIREILRLDSVSFSTREIARSVNKGSSVNDMIRRAREAGLEWSVARDIDDRKLEEMLYPSSGVVRGGKVEPDFPYVHEELKKKGVTRQLLWEEYLEKDIGSPHYSYPQFCKLYNMWLGIGGAENMRIGSIGPKNIAWLGKLFGLPDKAVMLAVSDFSSRLNKAHGAVDGSKNVGKDIKDKLHQQMEKRWNGTFDSIGTYLSKRQ